MELNLHAIATKCFVSGREFQENDRVVSYLVREANGEVIRRDVALEEDGRFMPPAFVFCRWTVGFKHRKAEENSAQTLKLTSENLFLSLAPPSEGYQNTLAEGELPPMERDPEADATNTPMLQFLALMLERKRAIKPIGKSADGLRTVYEHRGTHNRYEVPIGDLNVEFFQKIQEHLGVLVGTGKKKPEATAPAAVIAAAEPSAVSDQPSAS
ncbi:hypothetical protein [Oleiharenicola lentus]|uniref:hypothetical protein n=1 Tax=Oleiharenicola lentus TaxID=2508720 RepID=UPI003F671662